MLIRSFLLVLALLLSSPAFAGPPPGGGWETLQEAPVTFHFRPKDRGIAEALAAQSTQRLEDIRDTAGLPIPDHIDVVLAPTFQDFANAQPGDPPSWAAGTAYAERSEVYLRTRMPRQGVDPIDQVFVHELVHVLLGRSFQGARPPRWLNEGLARLLAREFRPAEQMELTRAALAGGLLSLEGLTERWPRGARQASLAYAQSVDFTAYLGDLGPEVLPSLVAQLARGVELEPALLAVTGKGLDRLEESWSRRISFWHAFLPVVGGSGFLWGIASAIFGVAAFRKRRSVKRRIEQMPTGNVPPVRARPVSTDGLPADGVPVRIPVPARQDELSTAIFGVTSLGPVDLPEESEDDEPLLH